MDRTTVSRRMRKIIAPQLEMLQGREKDRAGAKCSGFFIFDGNYPKYTYYKTTINNTKPVSAAYRFFFYAHFCIICARFCNTITPGKIPILR